MLTMKMVNFNDSITISSFFKKIKNKLLHVQIQHTRTVILNPTIINYWKSIDFNFYDTKSTTLKVDADQMMINN